MKQVAVLIAIYIAIAAAITEDSEVYRFTKEDGRKFFGTFVGDKNLSFVSYHRSHDNNTLYLAVADLQRTCGPYEKNYETSKHSGNYVVELRPLNEDKMLVFPRTVEESSVYVSDVEIVDLSSCKVSQILLPSNTKEQAKFEKLVGVRADSFDLAFHDSELCGDKICRQTYDFQGKNVSAPTRTPYGPFTTIPQINFVGSHLKSDGEIAIGDVHGKKIAFLVKDEFKRLQQFKYAMYIPEVATENNVISFAEKLESKTINVTQFDLDGNLKFKTVLSYDYDIRAAYLLNAPNGFLYVVASECRAPICNEQSKNHYVVKKVDASGKEIGSFVMEIPSTTDLITEVNFYKTNESYCISRLQGYSEELFDKVNIVTNCFNDSDFSK